MLKITTLQLDSNTTEVLLEGKLTRADEGMFMQAYSLIRQAGRSLVVNLNGLQYIDVQCVQTLQQLHKNGVQLKSPSPFVRELLETLSESN